MVQDTPTPAQPRSTKRWWVIAVIVGAVLLIVGGTTVAWLMAGANKAQAVTVQTEPISTAQSPFTPPVGTDTAVAAPVMVDGTRTVSSETVGIYGGSLDSAACDRDKLVAYLKVNPDKAAGWAQTLGISPEQIPERVSTLSSAVLRSDTFVTNHGWENGQVTTFPSVLQAGTAVLINDKGTPEVKCYCGNPLTAPPDTTKVVYNGPRWTSFRPGNVTVVVPGNRSSECVEIIDLTTNRVIIRCGDTDTPGPPASSASPSGSSTSPSGGSTSPSGGSTSPSGGSTSPSGGSSSSSGTSTPSGESSTPGGESSSNGSNPPSGESSGGSGPANGGQSAASEPNQPSGQSEPGGANQPNGGQSADGIEQDTGAPAGGPS